MRILPDTHNVIRSGARKLVAAVQHRLEGEEGFTLVELMIVLLTMGILLTIAVPSYLSFKDNADKTAAKQRVVQLQKAATAYRDDNFPKSQNDPDQSTSITDNGFENMNLLSLATKYDASLSTTVGQPYVINPAGFTPTDTQNQICMTAISGRWVAAVGADGHVTVGINFTPGTCVAS